MYVKKKFPEGFFWGTATASFQIEGAIDEDNKGESIWDRFCDLPGNIITGETGFPATDSYHRYLEDVELMRQLKSNAYRFSIAWSRIFPEGTGKINQKGLDYYERVVDALLDHNIRPFVTLYHWDLPQSLQEKGGWANRDTVYAFVDFTEAVVSRLGDKVKDWFTHNEPYCTAFLGNLVGEHAPGIKDLKTAVQVSHHVLLSHGMAIPVIKANCENSKSGIVLNFAPSFPATDSEADRQAAELRHAIANTWFLDPIYGRGYPQLAVDHYGDNNPKIEPGDMEVIANPFDVFGVNFYKRFVAQIEKDFKDHVLINYSDPKNITGRGWEVKSEVLFELLMWLHNEYHIKEMVVSENGADYKDLVDPNGQIHDPLRQTFIKDHLTAVWHAIQMGAAVKGYFCWSLLDNFEWAFGTSSRFGLVYTDFESQMRTIKESGKWYAMCAHSNEII
ncbi:MAG: GH1 family beta-glucosidase [Anaerolineaceae bacterium]|nr:GH1 family beta-glucosidase [Anaerolineaceae bacterium]